MEGRLKPTAAFVRPMGGVTQAEASGDPNASPSSSGDRSSGALAGTIQDVANFVENVFQVERLRLVPFQVLCKDINSFSKCSLQGGISLAQLLLANPRDGMYVVTFLRRTEMKNEITPTRRDLLPFMFFVQP